MSEDEGFVCVISAITTLISWLWWYGLLVKTKPPLIVGRTASTKTLAVIPVIAFGLLFAILALWSASDVRHDGRYMTLY